MAFDTRYRNTIFLMEERYGHANIWIQANMEPGSWGSECLTCGNDYDRADDAFSTQAVDEPLALMKSWTLSTTIYKRPIWNLRLSLGGRYSFNGYRQV